jgi:hypothetical protein
MHLHQLIQLFKNRKYKKIVVKKTNLIIDPNFDLGLREYYQYVTRLIIDSLKTTDFSKQWRILILCSPKYKVNIKNLTRMIEFQVEHTLVKSGGRGAESAPTGVTRIPNTYDEFYTVRLQNLAHLLKQDLIIEYSRPNMKHLQDSQLYDDYLKKVCLISPTIYPVSKSSINQLNRQYDTITLFRNTNEPRRKKFLETLETKHIAFKNVNHVFNQIDQLYIDVKILINIRQTDHHDTLEELRILPALRCGVIIVSEIAPLKEYCRYSDFILWGDLDNLPSMIQEVQNNYSDYHKKIFNSHFYRRMQRLDISNQLRIKKYLAQLN